MSAKTRYITITENAVPDINNALSTKLRDTMAETAVRGRLSFNNKSRVLEHCLDPQAAIYQKK